MAALQPVQPPEQGQVDGVATAQTAPASQACPAVDVADLWRRIRNNDERGDRDAVPPDDRSADAKAHQRFLVISPTFGSRPSTGLIGGANGNVAFFRGDPKTTHISTLAGGFRFSQKKQLFFGVGFSMFAADDRWFFQGDDRLQLTSQDIYGLGTESVKTAATNMKFNYVRIYETAYRRVRPGLFLGLGLNVNSHSNVRPGDGSPPGSDESPFLTYNRTHGFAPDRQTSSGTSIGLLFDTRDNAINPQGGWLASTIYRTFFSGFIGGDSTWQQLYLDLRTYKKLSNDSRHKLAFWLIGNLVTGGTAPYLDLPSTGSDGRSARGYIEGRYRGEHLVYGEVEYRGSLTTNGLLGFVAFLNATTVDGTDAGKKLFDAYAPAAGFGLRVLLNKRSRTNLAADFGWGKAGSRGFYLGIQEAF